MREVVLQLNAPHLWISEIAPRHHARIRVLDCKPSELDQGIRQLVEVNADEDTIEKIVNEVKSSPLVEEAYMVQTNRGRMLGSLLTESAFCRTVMQSEAFCRTCLFHSKARLDGTVEWTLAFNKKEALTELLDRMKSEHADAKILRLSSVADVENLTARQRSLIETALEKGFFDYPRRITLRELSKKLGISAATASEILRRAERKILSFYQTHELTSELEGSSCVDLTLEDLILKRRTRVS